MGFGMSFRPPRLDQSCQLHAFLGEGQNAIAYAADIDGLCELAQGRGAPFEVFCPGHAPRSVPVGRSVRPCDRRRRDILPTSVGLAIAAPRTVTYRHKNG